MRQGPGIPFGGMGPGMMRPGPMRQLPGQFGGPQMRAMGQTPYPMNPMMGMGRPAKQGGILARLLGGGKRAGLQPFGQAAGGAGRAAGGGLLNTIGNPGSIHSFLNNTQQVLKTAQSVGPMIQQYGPLVKNLPAMWKLYKGMKDLPDQEETVSETKTADEQMKESRKKKKTAGRAEESVPSKKTSPAKPKRGESTPKLFI
jgi:hypothetical protein